MIDIFTEDYCLYTCFFFCFFFFTDIRKVYKDLKAKVQGVYCMLVLCYLYHHDLHLILV